MDNLPEGSVEIVLGEDARAAGSQPSPGGDTGATHAGGGNGAGGNRSGYQDRIDQLTARRRDAERDRDVEAERANRLEADLAATKGQLSELARRQRATEEYVQGDFAARERAIKLHEVDGKLGRLQTDRLNALEAGDTAKVNSLDMEIAEAFVEKRELAAERPAGGGSRSQPTGQQEQQQTRQSDPETAAFLARNADWWQKDPGKTATAWEKHAELKARGVPLGTADYYREIEAAVTSKHSGGSAPSVNGGGASRGNEPTNGGGGSSNRVVLSKNDLDAARGMGLTPEQWARGVVLGRQRGEIRSAA